MKPLLSVAEAATLVQASTATIRRRIEDGNLNEVRDGAKVKVRLVDLQKLYPDAFPKIGTQTAKCRVIAFANQKGGVGKTTTCANLAAALSQDGTAVLAIDCDPQGNLTQALGPDPDALPLTLYNVLVEKEPLANVILTPILGQKSLALVPSNLDLAAADHQLAGSVARETRLRLVLEPFLPHYQYILLDCPPALGLLTLNALTAATEVIVPVDMGIFSLRGVAKLRDTITEVRTVNPELGRVRALASRADNTNLSVDVQAEMGRGFGKDMFETAIRRSVRVGEAQVNRTPLTIFRPKDPAALDYLQLAEEVRNGA